MEYLSQERYNEIVAELNHLIEIDYPKIKDDLAEARAQGDLSENCGYRAARRAQAKAISRIRFLQNILKFSRVIDREALPKDCVTLLSRVTFTNLSAGFSLTYTIVSPHEMNLDAGKISLKSPIGAALMGHHEGEVVEANVPTGVLKLRIDKIENF